MIATTSNIPPMNAPKVSVGKVILLSFLFALVFSGYYASVRNGAIVSAGVTNPLAQRIFYEYGYAIGPALALIWLFKAFVLIGIKRLIGLGNFVSGNALVLILLTAPISAFSAFLVYREPRHTEIARGIIDFFGMPLLASSTSVLAIALIFFFF